MSVPNKKPLSVLPRQDVSPAPQSFVDLSQDLAEQGTQLTHLVERTYVANRTKRRYTAAVLGEHNQTLRSISEDTHRAIRAWLLRWGQLLAEVGEDAEEVVLKSLQAAMQAELATLLQAHQISLAELQQVFDAELAAILARPEDEWVKETWADWRENLLTFGEYRLKLKGYPALSGWQAVLNPITGGLIAELAYRKAERRRLTAPAQGEEVVIDAPYTTE